MGEKGERRGTMEDAYAVGEVLVSIITVTLNSEATLIDTIESVLQQTYHHIEYLIVDGASTDDTISIANRYIGAFREKKIAYQIISEKDEGIYHAMNKGIQKTKGDIIGIINSDDWYEPNAVEQAVNLYKKQKYDLMYADLRIIKPNGHHYIKHAQKRNYVTSRDWNHPTQFVTKTVYDKLQYKCENISDDMDFYFKVIRAGYRVMVLNEVLANYRLGGVSTKIVSKEIIPRIRRRYRVYRNNGFSRFYMVECVGIEIVKFLIT